MSFSLTLRPMCLAAALLLGSGLAACETSDTNPDTSSAGLRNMAPTDEDASPQEPSADREPNDTLEQAVELTWQGKTATAKGALSGEGDIDVFHISSVPGADAFALTLTPNADGDPIVGVTRTKGSKPTYYDNGMAGQNEVVANVGLGTDGTYVAVQRQGGADVSYALEARRLPGVGVNEIEPNDRVAAAQALAPGQTLTAFANRSGDVDVYRIDASQVAPFDVFVTPPTNLSLLIQLANEDKEIWSERTATGTVSAFRGLRPMMGPNAFYTLQITALGEVERSEVYNLSIDLLGITKGIELEPNDELADAQPLVAGEETVKALLVNPSDVDRFVIKVPPVPNAALEVLHLYAAPAPTLDLKLSANFVELGLEEQRNDGVAGQTESICNRTFTPPLTLEVAIQAALSTKEGQGPYTLYSETWPFDPTKEEGEPNGSTLTASVLTQGQPLKGFVHPAADLDVYRFSIPPSTATTTRAHLELSKGVPMNLKMTVKDAESAVIAKADKGGVGEGEALDVDLPAGDYFVEVSALARANCDVPYELSLQFATPLVDPFELKDPKVPVPVDKPGPAELPDPKAIENLAKDPVKDAVAPVKDPVEDDDGAPPPDQLGDDAPNDDF